MIHPEIKWSRKKLYILLGSLFLIASACQAQAEPNYIAQNKIHACIERNTPNGICELTDIPMPGLVVILKYPDGTVSEQATDVNGVIYLSANDVPSFEVKLNQSISDYCVLGASPTEPHPNQNVINIIFGACN